jgi:hypothetical protein
MVWRRDSGTRVIGGRKLDTTRRRSLHFVCLVCVLTCPNAGFTPRAVSIHAVGPWDHICIDVGSLTLSSDGFCKILVAVDVATGFIVLRAMRA